MSEMIESVAHAMAETYFGRSVSREFIVEPCTGGKVYLDMARTALETVADALDEIAKQNGVPVSYAADVLRHEAQS